MAFVFPCETLTQENKQAEDERIQKIIYRESEEITLEILNSIIQALPVQSKETTDPIAPTTPTEPHYPYYTPEKVILHNTPDDCWVSFLGFVVDLTPLIKHYGITRLTRPILAFAGKDISHWFDEQTQDLRHYIHPITGVRVPYLPHGPIPDVQPQCPSPLTLCHNDPDWVPWWRNRKYRIGRLTERTRPIRIINMFTFDECTLNVCREDTIERIQERYRLFNSRAVNYTWTFERRVLDLGKTLEENGIEDERDKFVDLFLPESLYTPALRLYFNDDFVDLESENDSS